MNVEMISVLLVDDDPMVREVNRQFINQVKGFEVIGFASNGVEGIKQIGELKPDLVFMDIFMPEQDGLLTIEKIRQDQIKVDIIAVTAANDMKTVQRVLHFGVFDYIMKPFTLERVKQALNSFYTYKQQLLNKDELTQEELDHILHHPRVNQDNQVALELPKGLNPTTLEKVVTFISLQTEPVSAEEVSKGVGLARVTARRYLDYLEKQHKVKIVMEYGGIGRPVNQYMVVD